MTKVADDHLKKVLNYISHMYKFDCLCALLILLHYSAIHTCW